MYLILIILDCIIWIVFLTSDIILTNKIGYNIEYTIRDLLFINFWRVVTLVPAIEFIIYERLKLSSKLNRFALLLILRIIYFNIFILAFSSFLGIDTLYKTRYSSINPVIHGSFSVILSTVIIFLVLFKKKWTNKLFVKIGKKVFLRTSYAVHYRASAAVPARGLRHCFIIALTLCAQHKANPILLCHGIGLTCGRVGLMQCINGIGYSVVQPRFAALSAPPQLFAARSGRSYPKAWVSVGFLFSEVKTIRKF